MPAAVAVRAVRGFADALIWNWAIAGTDAHAKNYSLLLSGSQARLAPFYDVASALPYGVAEQKLRLAMKFGTGYRVNPGSKPWSQLGADLGLPADDVRSRARALLEAIPDAFVAVSSTEEVRRLGSELPDRLTDLVAERARRCTRLLG